MRVPDLRRLKQEDFDSKDQALIAKLAFPLNSFMEQTVACLNNGIDFQNLDQQLVDVVVTSTSSNTPATTTNVNVNTLNTSASGCICINAVNVDNINPTAILTGMPFVLFTETNGVLTITNVFGLPPGVKFQLTLMVIGS